VTFTFAFWPSGIMQFIMTGNPAWLRFISTREPKVALDQLASTCLLSPDVLGVVQIEVTPSFGHRLDFQLL